MHKLSTALLLSLYLGCSWALAGDAAQRRPAYGAAESAWEIIANLDIFEVLMNRATVAVELSKEGPNYRSIVAVYTFREPTNIHAQDLKTRYISDVREVVFNCDTGKHMVLIRTLWSGVRANGTQLARYTYEPSGHWTFAGEPGSVIGRLFSVACSQPSYWNSIQPDRVISPPLKPQQLWRNRISPI